MFKVDKIINIHMDDGTETACRLDPEFQYSNPLDATLKAGEELSLMQ